MTVRRHHLLRQLSIGKQEVFAIPAVTNMAESVTYVIFLLFLSAFKQQAACQATAAAPTNSVPGQEAEESPSLAVMSPTAEPSASNSCELHVLQLLGWQQAFNASGYVIDAELPSNCSASTWQALGCLQSVVSLTLTGTLPSLPDAWAANGSFPYLQVLNFSGYAANLAGQLPSSWADSSAFPNLQILDLSTTQISGTLPATWGQIGAMPALSELYLAGTNMTGMYAFVRHSTALGT